MTHQFLRIADVLGLIPVSRSTFHRMVRSGEFPAAVDMGGVKMWPASDVDKFMQTKIKERDAQNV
jgi:predicted DNA-binding transcriptional regulator AlpA